MSGRGLLILVVVLGVGIATVLLLDRAPREEKKAETLETLLPLKLDAVSALEREHGGEPLRLERDGEQAWRIAGPESAEADPRQVKALYEMLVGARVQRVVEEKASDLKAYGLEPPALRVRVFPKEPGAAGTEIGVGRLSPVGTGRYAGTAGGKVLLVEGLAGGALEQDAESFVEKRVFPAEADAIRRISLERAAGRLTLVRDAQEWRLAEPNQDAADSASVATLTRALGELSLSRFLEEPDAGTTRAALAKGALVAHVELGDGQPALAARFAEGGPGDERSACRESGRCGVVSASALRDLERPADDYRDRRLMSASADEVQEIQSTTAAGTLRVRRGHAGKEGAAWSVQAESAERASADAARVDALLDRLRWLRASSFEDPGIAPSLSESVVLGGEKGELGRLEFSSEFEVPAAKEGEPAAKRRYARSSWRPGILFTVPADSLGALPRSAADLASAGSTKGGPAGTP